MNVLFICTGNTCRSPMAEGYFRYLCQKNKINEVGVRSAGVGAINGSPASDEAMMVLKSLGIDLSGHKSQSLTASLLAWADIVVAMTQGHKEVAIRKFPEFNEKIVLLKSYDKTGGDIFDPIGGDFSTYKKCFADMKQALYNLFMALNN